MHIPQFDLLFVLESDASDYAIGVVLSHPISLDKLDVVNPVGIYSKKLTSSERNYDVPEKELLVLICAFAQRSHYFLSLSKCQGNKPI